MSVRLLVRTAWAACLASGLLGEAARLAGSMPIAGPARVAVVTGCARAAGIGRACAAAFLKTGAYRVIAIDTQDLEWLPGTPEAAHDLVHFGRASVSDPGAVAGVLREGMERFFGASGEGRVAVIVNCAGRAQPHMSTSDPSAPIEARLRDFDSFLDSHLRGAFVVTECCRRYFAPGGNASAGGDAEGAEDVSVVHIASTRARQSEPFTEGYAAAKAGMLGLTHAQAASFGEERAGSAGPVVRVNSISPGWIDTSGGDELTEADRAWHSVHRVGRPEDVAEMALFLADGRRSGFVTGQEFVLDGGVSARMRYND